MKIRKEEPKDYTKIYEVVKSAFSSTEHTDGNEQDLVNALRNGDAYIPELSLVAEKKAGLLVILCLQKPKLERRLFWHWPPFRLAGISEERCWYGIDRGRS